MSTILLTGFMGVGKSTVGRVLAARLGMPFFDLDEAIEERAGRSIEGIFESWGEKAFRDLERECLKRLLDKGRAVIATGGGTLAQPGIGEEVGEKGVTVWLDASLEVIEGRLERADRESRPLYGSPADVRELYARRLTTYCEADFRIEIGSGDSPRQVAERVIAVLRENHCVT